MIASGRRSRARAAQRRPPSSRVDDQLPGRRLWRPVIGTDAWSHRGVGAQRRLVPATAPRSRRPSSEVTTLAIEASSCSWLTGPDLGEVPCCPSPMDGGNASWMTAPTPMHLVHGQRTSGRAIRSSTVGRRRRRWWSSASPRRPAARIIPARHGHEAARRAESRRPGRQHGSELHAGHGARSAADPARTASVTMWYEGYHATAPTVTSPPLRRRRSTLVDHLAFRQPGAA